MKLSNYVHNVNNSLYNTVTLKQLPIDSDEVALSTHHFLSGQETDALHERLFSNPALLKLNIVPTWECSLRCNHCCVANRLVKKQNEQLSFELVKNFIDAYYVKYQPAGIHVAFIGGEPLLSPTVCLEIARYVNSLSCQKFIQITSNLIQDIDELSISLFDEMDLIAVSLDGTKEQHNAQRHSATIDNPHQVTLSNIQKLLQLGFQNKLNVQAAMCSTNTNIDDKKSYYRTLLRMGVKFENIIYGSVFPTLKQPKPDTFFEKIAASHASPLPCCRYRYMSNFIIDASHKIYIDYLDETKADVVGNLHTLDFESIEQSYKNCILKTMHALHDKNCMQCPAIGICWGGCIHNQYAHHGNPSSFCNQTQIIQHLNNMLNRGELIEVINKFVANKQCRINFIVRNQ